MRRLASMFGGGDKDANILDYYYQMYDNDAYDDDDDDDGADDLLNRE